MVENQIISKNPFDKVCYIFIKRRFGYLNCFIAYIIPLLEFSAGEVLEASIKILSFSYGDIKLIIFTRMHKSVYKLFSQTPERNFKNSPFCQDVTCNSI